MSYRLEQQSDGTSRIAEITGAEGLTLPRYRHGWVSVDEKAGVLDAVIADDGKSADVTVQYYASLVGVSDVHGGVHIVAPLGARGIPASCRSALKGDTLFLEREYPPL